MLVNSSPDAASSSPIPGIVSSNRPHLELYEDLYKHIHADPELSLQETSTSQLAASRLQDLGFTVTTNIGGHGLVGVLSNGPGRTVLVRADMDALPIEEQTGLPYASKKRMVDNDGVEKPAMHACGHDMHVSSLLAAAELLVSARSQWHGTLLALFQPNEERGAGARAMVDDGLYDKVPKPDVVLGGHVNPAPIGFVGTRPGLLAYAADSFKITVFGTGGHGSQPHKTVDPVVLAANVVLRLQTIVSREVDPMQAAVVTVGSLQAGMTENVIPESAVLKVNVRTFDPGVREHVLAAIKRVVKAECDASRSPSEPLFEPTSQFPLLRNDEEVTGKLSGTFREMFGDEFNPDMGRIPASEDFGILATSIGVPSCFWTYGCVDETQWKSGKPIPGNHSSLFAPVIQPTLRIAVDCYAAAALTWLTD